MKYNILNKFLIEQQANTPDETPSSVYAQQSWNNINNSTLKAFAGAGCFGNYTGIYNEPLENLESVYLIFKDESGFKTNVFVSKTLGKVTKIQFSGKSINYFQRKDIISVKEFTCDKVNKLADPPTIPGSAADEAIKFFYNTLGFLSGSTPNVDKRQYTLVYLKDLDSDPVFKSSDFKRYADRIKALIEATKQLPFAENTYFWMPTKKIGKATDYKTQTEEIEKKYISSSFKDCDIVDIQTGQYFYIDLSDYYSNLFQRGSYWCKDWVDIVVTPETCKTKVAFYQKSAQFNETDTKLLINQNKSLVAKCLKNPELNSNLKGPNPYYKPFDKKLSQLPKNYGGIIQYINNIPPSSDYSLRPRLAESEYKLGKLISESLQRLKMKKYNRY